MTIVDLSVYPRLTCDDEGFAQTTLRKRHPIILTATIDELCRRCAALSDGAARESLHKSMALLSKLKYSLWTDKPIEDLADDEADIHLWTNAIATMRREMGGLELCVYSTVPWLFEECYLYRRIRECMLLSHDATTNSEPLDPFETKKRQAWEECLPLARNAALWYFEQVDGNYDVDQTLKRLIRGSLWGNRNDLSLHVNGGVNNSSIELDVNSYSEKHILADNTQSIVKYLRNAIFNRDCKDTADSRHIDFVLDNAGFELFNDLLLADYLVRVDDCDIVVNLHVKVYPWFVSDATEADVLMLIDQLINSEQSDLHRLGNRFEENITEEKWVICTHHFWTLWNDYTEMAVLAVDLHTLLSSSLFIVFKGDLNYRKLLGDRVLPPTLSFSAAIPKFGLAPLCALRTNKSEVICGLTDEVLSCVQENCSPDWMVSGDYGVIQFHAD
eukprot:CFRG7524T1